MNVLAIDTAGPVASVAWVGEHGEHQVERRGVRNADSWLMPQIAEFLKQPVDAIAVSIGPGAFTSLRVGVAMALGIAESRHLPVFPISSLMARAALISSSRTLALLDARKQRLYGQLFDTSEALPKPLTDATDSDLVELLPQKKCIAIGEGALVYADRLPPHIRLATGADRGAALSVAQLARLGAVQPCDAAEIQLHYIRPPDAVPPKSLGVPVGTPAGGDYGI
ncbi:MAG: tRNA (adenosine(37)-N6)-threonylcarbamoyltransferase complex dimerization subunit type 1 TsaB [Myxococcota bacterium]